MPLHPTCDYGFGTTLNLPFAEAVEKVKGAFKAEGFGTLHEMDVQQTLHEKIEVEIAPYTVLGMCNPQLASRAIAAEPEIGLMLPCNILVRATETGVQVSAQDPLLMFQMTRNAALQPIAAEARQRIERALQQLAGE